jgi:outer membrane lipoprotein-sorting protein
LSDWDFSTQAPDSDFEFKPPAGVTQVDWGAKTSAASAPQK